MYVCMASNEFKSQLLRESKPKGLFCRPAKNPHIWRHSFALIDVKLFRLNAKNSVPPTQTPRQWRISYGWPQSRARHLSQSYRPRSIVQDKGEREPSNSNSLTSRNSMGRKLIGNYSYVKWAAIRFLIRFGWCQMFATLTRLADGQGPIVGAIITRRRGRESQPWKLN